jgi:hypothetical protein
MQPTDPYQPPQPPSAPPPEPPTVYQPGSATPPPAYQPYQQPAQAYQPYQQPPVAPAKSSNRTLFIVLGIVGGLMALCCIGGVAVVALYPTMLSSVTTGSTDPVVNEEPPIVDLPNDPGQPGGNAAVPVGTAVDVTADDHAFTIAVTSATWREGNCEENEFLPQPEGKLLVVDVTWEVTQGTASINPFFFEYVDSDGVTGDFSIFDGCEPALDSGNDFPAGTKRAGKVVFEVKGKTTGTVVYSDGFSGAVASWTITG